MCIIFFMLFRMVEWGIRKQQLPFWKLWLGAGASGIDYWQNFGHSWAKSDFNIYETLGNLDLFQKCNGGERGLSVLSLNVPPVGVMDITWTNHATNYTLFKK